MTVANFLVISLTLANAIIWTWVVFGLVSL